MLETLKRAQAGQVEPMQAIEQVMKHLGGKQQVVVMAPPADTKSHKRPLSEPDQPGSKVSKVTPAPRLNTSRNFKRCFVSSVIFRFILYFGNSDGESGHQVIIAKQLAPHSP